MNSAAFQLNKIRRLIKTRGKIFKFEKPGKDEFGEPNGETVSRSIVGVYHETPGYASGHSRKSTSEATTIRTKGYPMVLILWEDLGNLHHQDELLFNEKRYLVTEIQNVAEANLIANVSLEEVQT